ncbi:MAG: NEW3 domain-containing protein, partial [Acidobacteriota bacterium]
AAVQPIGAGLARLRDLRARLGSMGLSGDARYEIEFRLAQKEAQFESALLLTHGIRLEALADDGTVVAGQPVKISIAVGNNGPADVALKAVSLSGFDGPPASCTGDIQQNAAASCTADLRIAALPLSTPYWKARTDAARYDFEPGVPFGLPFTPTPFRATFRLTIGGTDIVVERPVEYRYSDLFAGEKRMELQVVPAFAVRLTPAIAVVPAAAATTTARGAAATGAGNRSRTIQVAVSNNLTGPVTAAVSLSASAGWQVSPASAPVTFVRQDEDATVQFTVTAGASVAAGEYGVDARVASATDSNVVSTSGYEVVEYPHIHRRHVIEPAHTRIKVMDVKTATGLRVGYIMGVGDEMPAAIEQLGALVHLIDSKELASGDLSGYNVIVTGVRAYERRPDLVANNGRLLRYVENGGVMLVNYNKQEFNQAQYGPFPAKNGTDRVTDENAPVEILVPDHPVFNTPNRMTPADWSGWVQERGTYFLAQHDPRYVDLIRMTDPFPSNPGPKIGALVEARFGKGRWLYIGLGLWRQLPAGTDGAYKLLANLLSLGAN